MATLNAPIRWLGGVVHGLATRKRPGAGSPAGPRALRIVNRFRRRPPSPGEEGFGGEGWGGVREPRRPRGTPPAGAMALREPAGQERTDLNR